MADKNYILYLVDDDIKTLIMLKGYIEKRFGKDVTVRIFHSGENCMDKMANEKVDIVVLDYYLNAIKEDAMNGLKVLQTIKSHDADTIVIMMSGQEDMETAIEAIRNGAYDYIIKNEKAMQRLELLINKVMIEG